MTTLKATYTSNNTVNEIHSSLSDAASLDQLTNAILCLKTDLNEYLTTVMQNNNETLETNGIDDNDNDDDDEDDTDEEVKDQHCNKDKSTDQQAKKQKTSP